VSAVVGLFGGLGAILGFATEGAHETVSTTALRLIYTTVPGGSVSVFMHE
jgi:hypothetical protein